MRTLYSIVVLALILAASTHARAAEKWGLKVGDAKIQSVGPLKFAIDSIIVVGDARSGAVFAIDTGGVRGDASKVTHAADNLPAKAAAALNADVVTINDLAVNPDNGQIALSVTTGGGKPGIVVINEKGEAKALDLTKVAFAKVALANLPEDKEIQRGTRKVNLRNEAITDIAFVNGRVLVSGLTVPAGTGGGSAQPQSTVRELRFPFDEQEAAVQIEIYHAAHGKSEDYAPIRTFIPLTLGGETSVLAGYTCTPLVKFPIKGIEAGKKLKGTTVAELGNRNQPLDIISYEKGGKLYLLMANSARGVMKITTEGLLQNAGLTEPVKGGGAAGQSYETIASLDGVVQLDKLNDTHAVVVMKDGAMKTVALP